MRTFFRFLIKLTGAVPAYTLLKPKVYRASGFRRPARGRSAILVCNHKSVLDVMLVMALFPFRSVRFLTGELMFEKGRLFRAFLWMLGAIRVDRGLSSDAAWVGAATDAARRGELICVFAEGHFNRTDRLLPFQSGAAFLAARLRLPMLPVYTDGAYGLFRRVRAGLGAPLAPAGGDPFSEAFCRAETARVRAAVQGLANRIAAAKEEEDLALRESWFSRAFYRFTQAGISLYLSVVYRPKILYTDPSVQKRRLKPKTVVVCNHVHIFDPPMLCTVFYPSRLHMLAAGDVFDKNGFIRWTLRRCNSVRIDRSGGIDTRCLRECQALLAAGQPVGLFPEGHIAPDGAIREFMAGYLMFALRAGAEVLPVCISGPYRAFGPRPRFLIGTPRPIVPPAAGASGAWLKEEGERLRQELIAMQRGLAAPGEG